MTLLVYALTSRGAGAVRLRGLRGERLETIRLGSIDAIVGAATRPPRPTGRTLRRYDRIIRALWADRPAVLPARFASMVGSRAELESTVRARQQTFRRRLALVRRRAQMTVRILVPSAEPRPAERRRMPRSGMSGRRYLEERARAARLEHVPEVVGLRAAVRRWVKAERAEARAGMATVYHLVPGRAVARYRQRVTRAAKSAQLRLVLTGPSPAYAFAEDW